MKTKLLFSAMLVCLLALGFTGCGDKDNGDPSSPGGGGDNKTIALEKVAENAFTLTLSHGEWNNLAGTNHYNTLPIPSELSMTGMFEAASGKDSRYAWEVLEVTNERQADTKVLKITCAKRSSYSNHTGTVVVTFVDRTHNLDTMLLDALTTRFRDPNEYFDYFTPVEGKKGPITLTFN
jgi:hypothetical protein